MRLRLLCEPLKAECSDKGTFVLMIRMFYGAMGTSITVTNHFSKVVADLSENDVADVTPKWEPFALIVASPRLCANICSKPERTGRRQNIKTDSAKIG